MFPAGTIVSFSGLSKWKCPSPDAIYIIVSNPVDILTYTFIRCSGLPSAHIMGSGTILDTARLRARLSEFYSINQQNVHAYVFGEHGDSSFIPWSLANISNKLLSGKYRGVFWAGLSEDKLTKMLLLDIGIGCLFFAILVGGFSAFRDFALSLQFGSNIFLFGSPLLY